MNIWITQASFCNLVKNQTTKSNGKWCEGLFIVQYSIMSRQEAFQLLVQFTERGECPRPSSPGWPPPLITRLSVDCQHQHNQHNHHEQLVLQWIIRGRDRTNTKRENTVRTGCFVMFLKTIKRKLVRHKLKFIVRKENSKIEFIESHVNFSTRL